MLCRPIETNFTAIFALLSSSLQNRTTQMTQETKLLCLGISITRCYVWCGGWVTQLKHCTSGAKKSNLLLLRIVDGGQSGHTVVIMYSAK